MGQTKNVFKKKKCFTASCFWIAGEPFDADTVADVIVWGAEGVGAAGVPDAGIGASQISDFAVFRRVAVRIDSAFRNWKGKRKEFVIHGIAIWSRENWVKFASFYTIRAKFVWLFLNSTTLEAA
jgi:hypothetical protein